MPKLAPHLDTAFSEIFRLTELDDIIPSDAIVQQISETKDGVVLSYLDGENFYFAHFSTNLGFRVAETRPLTGEFQLGENHVAFLNLSGAISILHLQSWILKQYSLSTADFNFSSNSRYLVARSYSGTTIVDIPADVIQSYPGVRYFDYGAISHPTGLLEDVLRECEEEPSAPLQFRRCVSWNEQIYIIFQSIFGTFLCSPNNPGDQKIITLPYLWFVGDFVHRGEIHFSFRCGNYSVSLGESDFANSPRLSQLPFLTSTLFAGEKRVPVTMLSDSHDLRETVVLTVHGGFGAPLLPFSSIQVNQQLSVAFGHVRGGGDLGPSWALEGQGENKQNAIHDLATVAVLLRQQGYQRIILSGSSHGGWLALVTALRYPHLIDAVSAICPIVDLPRYLATELGQKHRVEFPTEPIGMNPKSLLQESRSKGIELLLIAGEKDSIVQNQDYETFCNEWKFSQGPVKLLRHQGGHYVPPSSEIGELENLFLRFITRK